MRLPKFEYFEPKTLEAALSLLTEKGSDACVLAGGTDVLVKMRNGRLNPKAVIGLQGIEGLNNINFDPSKGLSIGSMARISDVVSHPDVLRRYPALSHAAGVMANDQVRNMGTIAGNLCNAAPSAENAPPLMAMGAHVTIVGPTGARHIPLDQFFRGPGLTKIEASEIMTSIFVPLPAPRSGASYKRISARCGVDIAAVCVGAMVACTEEVCSEVRIVLGAVAPVPMRASKAEGIIQGQKLTRDLVEKAAAQAAEESKPISDVRATADYRKKMVEVLTFRALEQAYERAMKL